MEHSPVATLDRAELIQMVGAAVQSHLQ